MVIDLAKLATIGLLGLLAPYLWLSPAQERLTELLTDRDWVQLVLFVASFCTSVVAIAVVPFLRHWQLRLLFATVFLFSFAVDYLCREILGIRLIANMYALIWTERSRPGPLLAYLSYILPISAMMLFSGAIWLLPPSRRLTLGLRMNWLPVAALAMATVTVNRDFAKTDQLPATVNLVAQHIAMIIGGTNSQLLDGNFGTVKRRSVSYSEPAKPIYRNIILIIDESIRGDYLQINNAQLNTTPFLAAHSSDLINFGVAISGTNCSGPSRFILRTGLQPRQLPDLERISTMEPTIWQYAHFAGMTTGHIDPWKGLRPFSSMMNGEEAQFIDNIVNVTSEPKPTADDRVADAFIKALDDPRPKFLIVEKRGAHVPYSENFPDNDNYKLSAGETAHLMRRPESARKDIHDYFNAVRWRVDHFFERVLPHLARTDTLTIYTSDHGQTMYEQNRPFTHCNATRALPGEGWVPLFVFGPQDNFTNGLRQAANEGRTVSHFQIFSTLLLAMGYDKTYVRRNYGASLADLAATEADQFYSPFIFGGKFSDWFPATRMPKHPAKGQ